MSDTQAESFEAFYARVIEPELAPMEQRRVAGVRFFYNAVAIAGVLALVVFLIMTRFAGVGPGALIFSGAVAVVGGGIGYLRLGKVATDVKATLLNQVAAYSGAHFQAKLDEPPAFDAFRANKLLPGHDKARFEDLLEGERAGARYQIYEAHLETINTDSEGQQRKQTVFRGQLVRISGAMRFHGVTLVLRDAGLFNSLRWTGRGLKRVGLVDPKFEKVFEVYSSDQVEARYLLTPAFMERLLALEEGTHGKHARAAFANGDLLVAIAGGNLFEAGSLFEPVATLARAQRAYEDVRTVHAVIDILMEKPAIPGGEGGVG